MEFPHLTSSQIMRSLVLFEKTKQQKLSVTQRAIFVSLYDLFKRTASYDEKKGKFYVQYSGIELANLFQLYHNRIYEALIMFEKIGLIERVSAISQETKSHAPNQPFLTYLNSELFL